MNIKLCLMGSFLLAAIASPAWSQVLPALAETPALINLNGSSFGSLANGQPVLANDVHVSGIPQLSSDPGAPYTIYLDFGGFNFTGTWGGTGQAPGSVAAFDGTTGSFSAAEQARIQAVWAGVAQGYAMFNINVTTVDPAVAAGDADTDAHRQAYYDETARMMHTIMTPSVAWYGSAGGVSYVGVTPSMFSVSGNSGAGNGYHTNWDFAQTYYTNFQASQPGLHENGHGLGLSHQGDYNGSTEINEYSSGDNNAGAGTYSPIMGAGYYTQRAVWRLGDSNNGQVGHTQNDISTMLTTSSGLQLINDGIGHSLLTATPIPLTGSTVNFNLAKGVIVPSSSSSPSPTGSGSYTQDYFAFRSDGVTPINLTINDGTEFITPGVADNGISLRSTLSILNTSGSLVSSGTEASSTLSETYSGLLPLGNYYADIASFGGHTQTLTLSGTTMNTTNYYDEGGYFVTGTGLSPAPEPGSLALLAAGGLALLAVRWRRIAR